MVRCDHGCLLPWSVAAQHLDDRPVQPATTRPHWLTTRKRWP